jgi:tRNA modification GTPase
MGGEVADTVVLAVRKAEPVPWLEVHCHGGSEVVRFLAAGLSGQGLEVCDWQDFLHRTGDDRLASLAAIALAGAATTRTAAILIDQHAGALGREFDAVAGLIDAGDREAAMRRLGALADRSSVGLHLTRPWRVVVAGAPNVGKSSLVNALAGFQRSIVSPTPGTTRDLVTTRIAADGWPVMLTDTAGLRCTAASLEMEGVGRARAAAAAADLCVWVLDAGADPGWPDDAVGPVRLVVNKVDLPAAWDLARAREAVHVSALTGAGLLELRAALAGWLVPQSPPPGAGVPFTPELAALVAEAWRQVSAGAVYEARRVLQQLRSGA